MLNTAVDDAYSSQVPQSAPASREQWKDWNQMWPISWRKPELTAVTAATAAAEAVTVEEEQQMHAWMDRAYDLAEANKSSGQICNAAVIVDPATGQKSMYCKRHLRAVMAAHSLY